MSRSTRERGLCAGVEDQSDVPHYLMKGTGGHSVRMKSGTILNVHAMAGMEGSMDIRDFPIFFLIIFETSGLYC